MAEWIVEAPEAAVLTLRAALSSDSTLYDTGIDRSGVAGGFPDSGDAGFRIELFAKERSAPHFRVRYGGQTNMFRVSDGQPVRGQALSRHFQTIWEWHAANKQLLIEAWNRTCPSDHPVHEYHE